MKYRFTINIYSDDDFCLYFVPRGMEYDDDNSTYSFEEEYVNKDICKVDVLEICKLLKQHFFSSRYYVEESFMTCINKFIEDVECGIDDLRSDYLHSLSSAVWGNYDIEFKLEYIPERFHCDFELTDEELQIIKKNKNNVTDEMVKTAVMALYQEKSIEDKLLGGN